MRETTRRNLYDEVAAAVVGPVGPERSALLGRLKANLYKLRAAYRSGTVSVSYADDEVVTAYMLAYYPPYAFTAFTAIRDAVPVIPNNLPLRVAFLGGGPLPELIGLLESLRAANRLPASIIVDVYDICGDWERVLRISHAIAARLNPEVDIVVNSHHLDFNSPLSRTVLEQLHEVQLVMLQNCTNEMVSSPVYHENISALSQTLCSRTVVVLADQANYDATVIAIHKIETALKAGNAYTVVRQFSTMDAEVYPNMPPPNDVRDEFFDGPASKDPISGEWAPGEHPRTTFKVSAAIFAKK